MLSTFDDAGVVWLTLCFNVTPLLATICAVLAKPLSVGTTAIVRATWVNLIFISIVTVFNLSLLCTALSPIRLLVNITIPLIQFMGANAWGWPLELRTPGPLSLLRSFGDAGLWDPRPLQSLVEALPLQDVKQHPKRVWGRLRMQTGSGTWRYKCWRTWLQGFHVIGLVLMATIYSYAQSNTVLYIAQHTVQQRNSPGCTPLVCWSYDLQACLGFQLHFRQFLLCKQQRDLLTASKFQK